VSKEAEDLNRRLLRARDAMDRAYAEPLDIRAVAAVACLSEAHFIRSFRVVFGETPHRYLRRRRVERSMFLLRETDRSVTDVCFDVGFTSLGTFSRTFREIVRWLTVRAPGETGIVEIYLEKPGPPAQDEATAEQLRELITKGAVGFIAFQTDDVRGLYETLRQRGVTDFTQEPTEHFYGTDMGIRDPFGNAIRIVQHGKAATEAPA
jgi:AraC-like DNA-binding protein